MKKIFDSFEKIFSEQVRLRTEWLTLSSDTADYDERLLDAAEDASILASAVLMCYVDCCKKLPLVKSVVSVSGKPDPIVQVALNIFCFVNI